MTRKEAQRRLSAAIREQQAVQKEVREANAHVVEATRKLPPYYVNKRFAEGERERIQKLIDRAQRASDRLGAATANVVNLRSLVSTQQVQKALPSPRHHATKKPPAQLQREIDEALAFRPDRGVLGEPRSSSRDVTVELLRDASYGTPQRSHVTSDREIVEALGAKPINKRKTVRHFSEWKDKTGRVHLAVTYEDLSSHAITPHELQRYQERESRGSHASIAKEAGIQLDPGEWWDSLSRRDRQTVAEGSLAGSAYKEAVCGYPVGRGRHPP